MRDLLPNVVLSDLRDRYRAGVAAAHENFDMSAADEDALTGALGQAIASPRRKVYDTAEGVFVVELEYFKLRGRGRGAAEKRFGADGIFQICVTDGNRRIVRKKGLPFQSKKDWRGKNSDLARQCGKMIGTIGQGLVIDFTKRGYYATDAQSVVNAEGSRSILAKSEKLKPLSGILAEEFLECRVGKIGLFYVPEEADFKIAHVLETRIAAFRTDT